MSSGTVYSNQYNTDAKYDVILTTFYAQLGAPSRYSYGNKPWEPITPTLTGVEDDTATVKEEWFIDEKSSNLEEVKTLLSSETGGSATVVYSYIPSGENEATHSITINYTSICMNEILTLTSPSGIYEFFDNGNYATEASSTLSTLEYYGSAAKGKIIIDKSNIENELSLSNLNLSELEIDETGIDISWWIIGENDVPVGGYTSSSVVGYDIESAIEYLKANADASPRLQIRYQVIKEREGLINDVYQLFVIYEFEKSIITPTTNNNNNNNSNSSYDDDNDDSDDYVPSSSSSSSSSDSSSLSSSETTTSSEIVNPTQTETVVEVDEKGVITKTTTYSGGITVTQTIETDDSISAEITGITGSTILTIPLDYTTSITEVAVIVYENGKREVIKQSTADGKGLEILISQNVTIEIIDNSKTFTDIQSDSWYENAVAFVTSRELFFGMGDSIFEPTTTMTCSMIWQVLYNYQGEFVGTNNEMWYSPAETWIEQLGLHDGSNPTDDMTREQIVTLLYKLTNQEYANVNNITSFDDYEQVSGDSVNAFDWAVANGIIYGSDGNLNPQQSATRAEVAAILMRFFTKS